LVNWWASIDSTRFALLSADRKRTITGHLTLLERHVTRERLVDDLSQHDVDAYTAARQKGTIESSDKRGKQPGVGDGTIRNELTTLLAMLNWGVAFRLNGRRLLAANPLHGISIPREKNAKRPLATEDRFRALLEVAARVEPTGRFRLLLSLARYTGRRINALANLRASDVLLSREQMIIALADVGAPIAWAERWPHGALRFSARQDKRGYESVVPLSRDARHELDVYLRHHPRAGDVPLLPANTSPDLACGKILAGRWLRKAEKLAQLPKLARGAWHAFRRQWASERRHLSAADTMAAGGWRSFRVMRESYQHADADGMLSVVDGPESRPNRQTSGSELAHAKSK
jgi:integrase